MTWFVAVWLIGSVSARALDVQAATGLVAIVVLLVITNWFFHRVYWTGWIGHHNQTKRRLLGSGSPRAVTPGLIVLGFASVYREGFEIVLFLQNMRIAYGAAVILPGVAIAAALVAIVAAVDVPQPPPPALQAHADGDGRDARGRARRDGRRAGAGDAAGRLVRRDADRCRLPRLARYVVRDVPERRGRRRASRRRASFVLGSYLVAGELRVRRPRRQGAAPAVVLTHPPTAPEAVDAAIPVFTH